MSSSSVGRSGRISDGGIGISVGAVGKVSPVELSPNGGRAVRHVYRIPPRA